MEDIVELAKKFIAIHSIEDEEKKHEEIISFAGNQLTEFTTERFISNGKPSLLIHNAKSKSKHFNIILNGHLDVVPGEKEQFVPFVKDNKLFGRGSYDMKAAAAVMLLVFKELAREIDYPLALQLVTDEEIGGHNGTKQQIEKGITADFVIAGEFTDYRIINKSKSILWLKIKTYGKTAHAAYPWLGENALLKMYSIVAKLQKIYPTPKTPTWQTTINVAKIETPNATFNKIPDECTAWLDVRVTPEEEFYVVKTIKEALPKDTKIEIVVQEKPAYTDPKNPFISKLQKITQKITNSDGEISKTHGASDIRFYNTMVAVPGVEFGPKGGNAHSDKEWVDINSLEEYYHILKQFLLSVS